MTRTDITSLFPEATKEQIDTLMGINGSDVNKAKGETTTLASKLAAAQEEVERLKGTPDQLTAAQTSIRELEQQLAVMKAAESVRSIREKVAGEKKIPVNLLTGDTEEACSAQADSILAFAKSAGYPAIKDGGETTANTTPTAKDDFKAWVNSR